MIIKRKTNIIAIITFVLSFAFVTQSYAQFPSIEEDLFFEDEVVDTTASTPVFDPHEEMNRKTFALNNWIMRYIANPIANVYDKIIPKRVQKSLDNTFSLTQTPSRFFNCLFQKKFKGSSIEFTRLLINSTLGIGGLFDPAKHFFNLEEQDEDFAQTLGTWGVDEGRYWIVPFFGPATTREVLGFVGNTAFNPFFWFGIYDVYPRDGFRAAEYTKRVNKYSYNIRKTFETITEDAIDPYIAVQHAFIQTRRKKTSE